jgi:hypothetical protein
MANGLMGAIINPAQADVIGSLDKGRQRQAQQAAGEILSQTMGGKLGALAKLNPDTALTLSKELGVPVGAKDRMNSMIGTLGMMGQLASSGLVNEAIQMGNEQRGLLQQFGIDTANYDEAINGLMNGDPDTVQNLMAFTGLLQPGVSAKEQAETRYKNLQSQELAVKIDQMISDPDSNKEEVRKELRGDLKKQRKFLMDEAQNTLNNYRKLQSLSEEVRGGNRSAAAQLGVTLVKLGDANSVVKEEELRQAFAAADPTAALGQLVSEGKLEKDSADTLSTFLDPMAPGNINVDAILDTGQAMVNSAVPVWEDRYSQFEEQGTHLTDFGRDTIFSKAVNKIKNDMLSLKAESGSGDGVDLAQLQRVADKLGITVEQARARLDAKR